MKKQLFLAVLITGVFMLGSALADGNPNPGYPHDTIMIHVLKADSGPKQCDGGHSLFVRHVNGVIPETYLNITMTDWVQVDNDGDGKFDEDPVDGYDDDGDGLIDEDDVEPGAVTTALDCDSLGDGELTLQIRDADPRAGYVSTQDWFIRLVGKPEQNFAFTTYANQTVSCTLIDPDLIPDSDDETVECQYGEMADWVQLSSFNLAELGCVKRVKLAGKNGVSKAGKTPFCDITDGFLVDVDTNNDGVVDLPDQFIFSVSCVDNLDTPDIDESLYCPLSELIWEIDPNNTTSQATAQIFVSHSGSAAVTGGKIR
jgi:hypothetical protein